MISLRPGKEPEYKGLWTLCWKGRGFFGNLRPGGFFLGFKERHYALIWGMRDNFGKWRAGVMLPNGMTRVIR